MSTVGENIDEVERLTAEQVGTEYAVALSCGTAAMHLCYEHESKGNTDLIEAFGF